MGHPLGEVHKGRFCGNNHHVADPVGRDENPFHREPHLLELAVDIRALGQPQDRLRLMDGHSHV